jgi:predicted  nucleic acid-binding Zn-ribbon protein
MKPAPPSQAPLAQTSQNAYRAYRRATDILNDRSAELALKVSELEVELVDGRIKEIHAQIDELERKS